MVKPIRYAEDPEQIKGLIGYHPQDQVFWIRCLTPEYNFVVTFKLYRPLLPEEEVVLTHLVAKALAGKPAHCPLVEGIVAEILEDFL